MVAKARQDFSRLFRQRSRKLVRSVLYFVIAPTTSKFLPNFDTAELHVKGVNFSPNMRPQYLLGALVVSFGAFVFSDDDLSSTKDVSSRDPATSDSVQTVVHSARLGEIDADTPVYRSHTNAEIRDKLNQIHLLTAYERLELLKELHHRIKRDGEFTVEKHERRFGQVVSAEPVPNSDDSEELVLEDIVIHRIDSDEEEIEAPRDNEVRKSRPPVRRLSSGRSYSSQQ